MTFGLPARRETSVDSVVKVGFRLEWEFAVIVRNGLEDKPITGPREALKFLQKDFAVRSGHQYWQAISACNGALKFRCELDTARTCFVVAYAHWKANFDH